MCVLFGESRRNQNRGYFMKTVNARDLQKKIKQCVDVSQQDRIVITCRGKPAAVMVGVEGKDWEEVALQTSSNFWKLVEERRNQPTISMKELRKRIKERKK
jgi:prevent-host-death family protein